ncbi:MAG: DUF1624 domain-containing protein [bacterium]|nr:DUF1624 domain-containing protein [bacterium]
MTIETPSSPPIRLLAVDFFRGLTVALMILVNNPGSWARVLPPLRHAAWHGLTPTDLVFPFFLFIVGVAVSLSLERRCEAGEPRGDLLRKILRRAVLIFACGLLLNGFPFGLPLSAEAAAEFSWSGVPGSLASLRIMGVLQRIALCYLVVGLLAVFVTGPRGRLAAAGSLVLAYEMLMRLPLVDRWGAGSFDLADNFARRVDLAALGEAHLWTGAGMPADPEGLVPTLTAALTTLAGLAVGRRLRTTGRPLPGLLAAGAAATAGGLLLALVEPVNKQLWTVSYTILTAGLATLTLALSVWLIDVRGAHGGTRWAVVYGSNPLVAFVGSGLLARVLLLVRVGDGAGGTVPLQRWFYNGVCVPVVGPLGGSLLHAVLHMLLWLGVLWWLYRRRIFVKI